MYAEDAVILSKSNEGLQGIFCTLYAIVGILRSMLGKTMIVVHVFRKGIFIVWKQLKL